MNTRCPLCNTSNRENSKFCRHCGKGLHQSKAAPEPNIICPRCKKFNKIGTEICSCGFNFQEIMLRGEKTRLISRPRAEEEKIHKNKDKIKTTGSFGDNLLEFFETDLEGLNSIISYQQYLFEFDEKGLAIISEKDGRFITVNSKFEQITGFPRNSLAIETFDTLISKVHPKNNKYDMDSVRKTSKFWIFDRDNKKISVKVNHGKNLDNNNSILITLEDIAETILKKDREVIVKRGKSATKNLYLITRISEDINRSLDIETILNNTLDKAMSATSSDVALIMFMDEDKNLDPIASRGVSNDLLENLKIHTVKADTGSTARALSLGRTVDVKESIRMLSSSKILAQKKGRRGRSLSGALVMEENLSSMVTVPLKSRDEIIGTMSLGSRKKENYSGKDLELLDSIGNHVAIAIRNSRLYSQTKDQLKELEEKNRRLRELEDMKKRLTRMIVHDLKSPLASIMAYADYVKAQKGISRKKLIEFFESIHESTQDTLIMVMNLLDISKMEEEIFNLTLSRVNLWELTDKVLNELEIKLNKKKSVF